MNRWRGAFVNKNSGHGSPQPTCDSAPTVAFQSPKVTVPQIRNDTERGIWKENPMKPITLIESTGSNDKDAGNSESSLPEAPFSPVPALQQANRTIRAAQPQQQQNQPPQPVRQPQRQENEDDRRQRQQQSSDQPRQPERERKPDSQKQPRQQQQGNPGADSQNKSN
jgi:hypothetical protein